MWQEVAEETLEVPNWMKVVVPVWELVEPEVIEVVKVEVAEVEALVVEPLAVDLSRKVRCVRWRPKEVEKDNVESCRKRSHCGDPVAVPVPLVVEVQNQVEVLGDDVGQVHRTWMNVGSGCGDAVSSRVGVENWYPGGT